MERLARRVRRLRQILLPLLGLTDWYESVEAGRPVWARYISETDSWEFRHMTPEEEKAAYWWMYPPYG